MEEVGCILTGIAWTGVNRFCLTGMAWNGKSQFCSDWSGLEWRRSVLACLAWPGMEKVNFGLTGIGQEELVSCSSDYSTRWLAIK
jgi:hypothetical protein